VITSDIIGIEVLPDTLAKLGNQYTKLQLELVLSDKPQNLLSREADIAVRMFRPTQSQLIARRVGTIYLGFYAHINYLKPAGMPASMDDLMQHKLIGFDQYTDYIRDTLNTLPVYLEKQHFSYRTDSNVAQLSLIRAGAGIGVCQVPLAARDSSLSRVLAGDLSIPMEIWVTMHEDLRKSTTCQAVFDALVQGLSDYVNK
jgi:DNA-binding transcriptional LysR family regulator